MQSARVTVLLQRLSCFIRLAKCTASCRSERRYPLSELQNTQTFSFSCNSECSSECSLAVYLCRPVFVCMRYGFGYVCKQTKKRHSQSSVAVLQSPATAGAVGCRRSVVLHTQFSPRCMQVCIGHK